MDELRQIKGAILPDETLLVVDAMTGQEAAILTAKYNQDIGITGAILTKMDGDTRGGAALSVRGVSGKPIKFVGIGEGLEDLEPFYPDRIASRILGMGDIQTLLEKAQVLFSFLSLSIWRSEIIILPLGCSRSSESLRVGQENAERELRF